MKTKKFAALLLALMLMLGLTACQKDKAPKVGLCFRQCDDSVTADYRRTLESALTGAGFRVTAVDAKNDQAKQTQQIGGFIDEEYDLLIIEPVMTSAAGGIVEQVKAADIPAVFVNREPELEVLESWDKTCYVGCDAIQPGLLQGQIILETPDKGDINGDGIVSYIVISGPEDHMDAQARTEYCVKELTYTGIEVSLLRTDCGDWTKASGERICAYALSQFGKDIEVVFCNNDAMALGALSAIQDGGRVVGQDIYLVGIDADKQALEMVQNGSMTGTVSTDLQGQAEQVTLVAKALLNGKAVEKQYYIDYVKVAQENVEAFMGE